MASPAFNRDFEPVYHQIEEISPLVRRVIAKNPNPFTFKGTGTYIIGRGEVAVIDPGPNLDSHLDEIVGGLDEGESVNYIIATHTHSDHTAGVDGLVERTGAPTFGFGPHGPVPDLEAMDSISFDEYFTAEESERIEAEWADTPDELKREGADTSFVPDIVIGDGDTLDGDGWSLEAVHTPGHTSNHLCFALAEESLLFTGDHVMGWATSVISPPDGDLFDYLESLEKVLARPEATYWPTHGPAITDPSTYVRAIIEHRRSREAQIVDRLGRGQTTIKAMVPDMYAEVDKRLWRAAAASVFSHLLALHRSDRVDTAGEPGLMSVWELS